ncbi:YtxH domain-containing protein [Paenibacillus sanguinis]|uniref:YtxH domain-containing protein n=1 Tax=Paenibacillus sanguinis TaxID=225906 RepID=UPI0003806E05|nr:YtxH domain-containing protein [Paenibacillus sanguinis]
MSKGNKGWLLGAAIGTIIGSVTALLFAPKPGKELRKDIADGARQVGEKTQEVAGMVTEKGTVLVDKVKETAGDIITDIRQVTKEKAEQVSDIVEDTVETVKEVKTVVLGVVDPETDGKDAEAATLEAAVTAEEDGDVK